EEERQLEQERQTSGERIHAALPHQLLLGRPDLHRVALEPAPDLLELRLQKLHPPLRDQLSPVERDEYPPHDQREDDDAPGDGTREAEAIEELVDPDHDDEHHLEDRREQPSQEADRIGTRRGRGQRGGRRRRCPAWSGGARDARDDDRDDPEDHKRWEDPAQAGREGHRRAASLADRVIPTRVPGVTSGDPLGPHPAPLDQAVFHDGLLGVVRTRRLEAARRRKPREDDPVELDGPDPDLLHRLDPPTTPPRTSVRCNAPTTASWSAPTMPGRAMMRTSQPGWNEGAITLSASRSRRPTLFRTSALPNLRPVEIPKRVAGRSVRRNRAESRGWDLVVPFSWIAAKSCGRESIASRGDREPRSVVRRSAASGPELAAQPGSGVPRSSSCGRESRAPWHDGASWAGTSASSGRSCDPLDPTSGTVAPSSPRGTQTRRMCRRAYGAASAGG